MEFIDDVSFDGFAYTTEVKRSGLPATRQSEFRSCRVTVDRHALRVTSLPTAGEELQYFKAPWTLVADWEWDRDASWLKLILASGSLSLLLRGSENDLSVLASTIEWFSEPQSANSIHIPKAPPPTVLDSRITHVTETRRAISPRLYLRALDAPLQMPALPKRPGPTEHEMRLLYAIPQLQRILNRVEPTRS